MTSVTTRRGFLGTLVGGILGTSLAAGAQPQPKRPPSSPYDSVPVGQWKTFSNTKLATGNPADAQAAFTNNGHYLAFYTGGNTGVGGMWAYSGFAYDTDRNKVLACANGGHADYAGNEVYELDLESVGLGPTCWTMPIGPTVNLIPRFDGTIRNGSSTEFVYNDELGTYGPVNAKYPCSVHSYGARVYMPTVRRVLIMGGINWPNTHTPNVIFHYNPAGTPVAGTMWELQAGDTPLDLPSGGLNCVWDSRKKRVVYHGQSGLSTYDPLLPHGSRFGTLASGEGHHSQASSACYDSRRHRYVEAGRAAYGYPGISFYDLTASRPHVTRVALPSATVRSDVPTLRFPGDQPPWDLFAGPPGGPGFVYDELRDRYILWIGDAGSSPTRTTQTYWEIHPDTWAGTQINATGDMPAVGQGAGGGITGTGFLHYVPQDVYVLLNSSNADVMAVRPPRRLPPGTPRSDTIFSNATV